MVNKVIIECKVCREFKRGDYSAVAKGLVLKGHFVCWDCHDNINYLEAGDGNYDLYKDRIKKLIM